MTRPIESRSVRAARRQPQLVDALLDELLDDADPFFRVFSVRAGPRQARGGRQLQLGPPPRGTTRQQLWGTGDGVFLGGASRAEAEQWARQHAARVGGTILHEQHGQGRPHWHVVLPGDIRSGHIFYGEAPSGSFFDYDY